MEQLNSEWVAPDVCMAQIIRFPILTCNFFFTAITVSSSIKALASSLGLKRNPSKSTPSTTASSRNDDHVTEVNDELARNSVPYTSLPPASSSPQTDHFVLNPPRMPLDGDMEIPLPGHVLRPGIPAPANARLSLGLGLGAPSTPTRQNQPTTTIRLISNPFSNADFSNGAGKNGTPQLQPFKTTFDLILDSPTPSSVFGSMSTWPPRDPEDNFPMYPTLTVDDLPPSLVSAESPQAKADRQEKDKDVAMPGSLTPVHARTPFIKSPEPFIFGSPLPQHNVSNAQFRVAAASVLEEMNKRLREEGVDEIQSDIIAKLHPHTNILHSTTDSREIKPMPGARRGEIKEKFQKLHESEFEKMEGIDALVKRRNEQSPQKRASEEERVIGKKRKSGAMVKESVDVNGLGPRRPSAFASRASSTRVISNGRRSKVVIPGAFGSEEEEEDDDVRTGKRAKMDSEVQLSVLEEQRKSEQEIRLEREHEAIRKKLEANRARRRSSAAHGGRKSGRISTGRPSLLGEIVFSFSSSSSAYNVGFHYQVNLNPSLLALDFCHLPNHLFKVCGIVERLLHLPSPAISPSLHSRMWMPQPNLLRRRLKWVLLLALKRSQLLHLPTQRQLLPVVAEFLQFAMLIVNPMQK